MPRALTRPVPLPDSKSASPLRFPLARRVPGGARNPSCYKHNIVLLTEVT
eukprot:TRINITY_DN363_c0_g1_i2.p1 TRINITY_DN363_c0_g1~~TRINITY_DN363_c0_g1_i2.p1  ORF type:complete len:50 (+),score=3.34 TRINITY_DN363_c0_g1_i2:218-367(+)